MRDYSEALEDFGWLLFLGAAAWVIVGFIAFAIYLAADWMLT